MKKSKLTASDAAKGHEIMDFRHALVAHAGFAPLEVGKSYGFRLRARENWIPMSRTATQEDIDAVEAAIAEQNLSKFDRK